MELEASIANSISMYTPKIILFVVSRIHDVAGEKFES